MLDWLQTFKNPILFVIVTGAIGGYLGYVLNQAEDKTALLPGKTTHGHHQIEMECAACHTDEKKENIFTTSGVPNSACNECHGEALNLFSDSHRVRKFKNPENAIFLEHIDAMSCVACHGEHNEKITGTMGVTLPADYCAHCHSVTLETVDSHKDLAYDSCATAGCHNYHDNMALSPTYLLRHYGEPFVHPEPVVPESAALARWLADGNEKRPSLTLASANAPSPHATDTKINDDWQHSAHALAGVNCSDCHGGVDSKPWVASPDHNSCATCHDTEVHDFKQGKHGMRLAHEGLSPMTTDLARAPMKPDVHASLSCNSCHQPHAYDRKFAAQEACVQCHNDEHTQNFSDSTHARLWEAELAGTGAPRTGVSCATCHMPREERSGGTVVVNHDQTANLRPNEKMLRNVCVNCHGVQFALDSLADRPLIDRNFIGRPSEKQPGIDWTVESAVKRGDERVITLKKQIESAANPESTNLEGSSPAKTKSQ